MGSSPHVQAAQMASRYQAPALEEQAFKRVLCLPASGYAPLMAALGTAAWWCRTTALRAIAGTDRRAA
eukprot:6185889-Pleurochrysis_carterae.AAC.3